MYEEGLAKIKYSNEAFLNPKARVSRDISVLVLKAFPEASKERLLDSTAATGIRGIRYAKECKFKDITMLDMNSDAYSNAVKNVKFNRVKAKVFNKSIQEFANTTRDRFGVVDLDPFGSCAPNVNDILKVVKNGTLLFATSTDTAVLCGAHAKACVKVYDAQPLHVAMCNEVGLRILIGYIARFAAQFNMGIRPIVSFSHSNHMRTFVEMRHGATEVSESLAKVGYISQCPKCAQIAYDFGTIPKRLECAECGTRLQIGGRLWCGNLRDEKDMNRIVSQAKSAKISRESLSLIERINGEIETVGYFSLPKLSKSMKVESVSPDLVIKLLLKKKFRASRTHLDNSGIKTDARVEDVKKAILSLLK